MTDEMESMALQGRVEPPKANGEVIFDEPWQNRTFGMARSLCEAQYFTWDEFRACLMKQIDLIINPIWFQALWLRYCVMMEIHTASLKKKMVNITLKTTRLLVKQASHI